MSKPRYTICPSTAEEMITNWRLVIYRAHPRNKTTVRLEVDEAWGRVREAVLHMEITDEMLERYRLRRHNPAMTKWECSKLILYRLIAVKQEILP